MKAPKGTAKRAASIAILAVYMLVLFSGFFSLPVKAAGPAEIGQGKPATASKENQGRVAGYVNDGMIDSDHRWYDGDNKSDGNWVAIDLESTCQISKVVVYWDNEDAHAKQYEIQISDDGEEYTTVASKSGIQDMVDEFDLTETGRFVRLYIVERGEWGTSVQEMQVFGVPEGEEGAGDGDGGDGGGNTETPLAQLLEAEDGTLVQGAAGEGLAVHSLGSASGGKYVDGFSASGDGAGVVFAPVLTGEPVTYQAVLGYAREFYEQADTISVYVNEEKTGQFNLVPKTSDINVTIRSAVMEIDLQSGDTLSVKVDAEAGDKGYLRMDYLELTPKDEGGPEPDDTPLLQFAHGRLRMQVGDEVTLRLSKGDINEVDLASNEPSVVALEGNTATALADGTAIITATSQANPEDFAQCTIVVTGGDLYLFELEAEDGTLVDGEGLTDPNNPYGAKPLIVLENQSGASGKKAVDCFSNSGHNSGVEFTMPEGMEDIVYELSVRYARDNYKEEVDTISIWVNGARVGSYKCPARSSYVDYGYGDAPVLVPLKAGDTLKIGVDRTNGDVGLYRVDMVQLLEHASIPLAGITLPDELTLLNREKARIEYETQPAGANTEIIWESSNETILTVDNGIVKALAVGEVTVRATSAMNQSITGSMTVEVLPNDQLDTIASGQLEVLLSKSFPRVFEYRFTDSGPEAVMQGGSLANDTMVVNGSEYQPEVSYQKLNNSTAKYTMAIKELDAVITVELTVENNLFKLDVTGIQESGKPSQRIFTLGFPDHNIVSVGSKEAGAAFAGSVMKTDLAETGDTFIDLTASTDIDYRNAPYLYAFLSNENMAVGIRSNAQDSRLLKRTVQEGSQLVTSLWSGEWRYRADDYKKTFQDMDGRYGAPGAVVTNTYQADFTEDLPLLYLAFARDVNGSGTVDWQDGAVAFRDIMETATGMDYIPDAVVQRLVFPQSGEGNYSYIASLDETKRTYLATDGLGQLVLNKYHNEGIWGDFTVFDERLGGIDEFNYYVSESVQNYNAWQGVHTNYVEIFASAGEFRPERIKMHEDGVTPESPGFTAYSYWLQQCYVPDVTFDAISLERMARLVEFAQNVPDLGFVYSDVFSHSGWQGRRLAEDYKAAGLGYFVEWPYQNEAEAVWAHWAVEKMYSPVNLKAYNSDIARFIFNHTKDRWDNYSNNDRLPNASNLLMGADTTTYEGWPNRDTNNSFNQAMRVVFDNNLPTKYMQHFPILRMEKDDAGWATHIWFEGGVEAYHENGKRIITKDGKVIYNQDSYLIPWNEGLFGNSEQEETEVKLYHWNENGGTTTWQLPDSWGGTSQVYVYRLTDQGRTEKTVANVSNGSVTLADMQAKTAYVVYKEAMDYVDDLDYGAGSYVADPGFNYGDLRAWDVEKGSPAVVKNDTEFDDPNTPGWGRNAAYGEQRNYELVINGADETAVSQEITGLAPGEYAASVMVEIQQGKRRQSSIIVESGGKTYTNYADSSILYDYDLYDSKVGTYMLRMRVTFVVPEGETTTKITLHTEEGSGKVRFDNVRVYATTTPQAPEGSRHVVLYQDFEYAIKEGAAGSEEKLNRYKPTYEGYYPFNIGSSNGIHETRMSIQTANPPYTENGTKVWDPATVPIDDVLEGQKALKILGTEVGIAVQTTPQTVRFVEGETYRVSFMYQTQPAADYAFVIGDGAPSTHKADDNIVSKTQLEASSQTILFSEEFVAGSSDYWFGIYRTKMNQSTSTNPAPIVLDNILVELVKDSYTIEELDELVVEAYEKVREDYTETSWARFAAALADAEAVLAENGPAARSTFNTQAIYDAYVNLYDAMARLELVNRSVTGVALDKAELALLVGETHTLTPTVYPANATNKQVSWASSDTAVATVNADGTITAHAGGTATITVTTKEGGFTANCAITVTQPTDLAFAEKPSAATFKVGETFTLVPNYSGGSWQYDSDFLSADFTGKAAFTTQKVGITVVRYTLGSVTAEFEITVLDDSVDVEKQTYRLYYDINWGNGGDGGIKDTTKYKFGDEANVTDARPVREGYTFEGWNTRPDGSGLTYKAGDKLKLGADCTLYAQWQALPEDGGNSDGNGNSGSSGSSGGVIRSVIARTGDSAATMAFVILAGAALIASVVCIVYRVHKRKKQ